MTLWLTIREMTSPVEATKLLSKELVKWIDQAARSFPQLLHILKRRDDDSCSLNEIVRRSKPRENIGDLCIDLMHSANLLISFGLVELIDAQCINPELLESLFSSYS